MFSNIIDIVDNRDIPWGDFQWKTQITLSNKKITFSSIKTRIIISRSFLDTEYDIV